MFSAFSIFNFFIIKERNYFEFAETLASMQNSSFHGIFFILESKDISLDALFVVNTLEAPKDTFAINLNGMYPEFEESYGVYSKNEEEALLVVTKSFLEPIRELSQKWGTTKIRWSFVGNKMHLALRTNKRYKELFMHFNSEKKLIDYFEKSTKEDRIIDSEIIKETYNDFEVCMDVIEKMSAQLAQIPEDVKTKLQRLKKLKSNGEENIYDHLIDNNNLPN